jgi:hypothetical protein
MPEIDGAEQNEEIGAGLEEQTGAGAEETLAGEAEERPAKGTEAATSSQDSAGEGLYEKLFGADKPAQQKPSTESKPQEAEKKDSKDEKDQKDNTGGGKEKPGKAPLTEKWAEGHEFQSGRDRLIIGKNISVSAANEIRRGRIALAEVAKTKQELERMKQDRTNGTDGTNRANRTDFQDKTLPQKAGEITSAGVRAEEIGSEAAPTVSPAAPSVEMAAKRDELVKALKEELGEETAKKLTDFLDLTTQAATAELTRKNEALEREIRRLNPVVERHQAALSEVEQRQSRDKNLETMERHLDENPQLREYGADAERMMDLAEEALQSYLTAGYTWEQMNTPQGAIACMQSAKSRLMEEYLNGLQGRKTGSETEKRAPKSSPTAPRGAASIGNGGSRDPRDANAQALALVNGR